MLILIVGHLANAPRPLKEASALRTAGAEVVVRGVWWNEELACEDWRLAQQGGFDFAPVVDLRPGRKSRLSHRLRLRLAGQCFDRFGLVTSATYGIGARASLQEARRIRPDLTLVHSEPGLWVAKELLEDGLRVGVDFEDWFSQDLLPADRRGRPVAALQTLERYMLRNAHCCITTTRALAEALAVDAGTIRVPVVVPNCFPSAERPAASKGKRDAKPEGVVSFHWFSQTIGPGRGLEILAATLPMLSGSWMLTLRGSLRGYSDWFNNIFPEALRSRVHCLDRVPNDELLAKTMSHDVGLALEQPYCLNKDLTASNKIFEYMRAGLAIIATRTRGQEEVMRISPDVGVMVSPQDVSGLAIAMQGFIDNRSRLQACQKAAAAAAEGVWAWEHHVGALLDTVGALLVNPPLT